jgi:hypothetical protein
VTDRLTLAIGHAVLAHAVYSGRTWTALALGIVVGIHAHLVWRRWQR